MTIATRAKEWARRSPWLWIGLAVLALTVTAFWIWEESLRLWADYFLRLISQEESLTRLVQWLGWGGPLGLIVINALQIIIASLPNYAIFVVAGFLYGPVWGGIYGVAGMLLGGVCAMLLTRRFGRPLAERMVGAERLNRWDQVQATQSVVSWSILFLAPVWDIPYFLAGLAHVSVAKVVVISAITRGPTIFLIATASSGVTGMTWPQLVGIILALVVIFGLLAYYQQPVLDWFDRRVVRRMAAPQTVSRRDAEAQREAD